MSNFLFKSRDPAIAQCNSLDEYENNFVKILSEEPSKITLLYQLSSISDNSANERLFTLIKEAVAKVIEKNYPVSFSYFLVLIGIDYYKGGEYWSAVWNKLSLPININRQTNWGNLFLRVLEKYKLPEFEDESAHRYVTPILGHGGIPNYCLPDFFEKLLLPIINGEIETSSTSIGEILQDWKRCSSLFAAADKPVYRFLLHGGKVANDFLTRCIQVAQDIIDGSDIKETYEYSQVPERVIERFKDWHKNNKDRIKKSTTAQIKPPKIIFDELENSIKFLISEQTLSDDCSLPVYELYTDNNLMSSQKVKSYRYTNKTMIDEAEFILPPAKNYSIRLMNNNYQIRKWEFIGLKNESIWMAFSDDRDRAIIKKELLPRSSFWLVYKHSLKIKETNCIIEEPVFLAEKWKDYKYTRINTERITSLTLLGANGNIFLLPLSSSKEPYLNRESLHGLDIDGYPLFSEELPSIHIPFDNTEELNQWAIRMKPIKQNQNAKSFSLSEVCQSVNNNEAIIDLSDSRLIGECPFGIFDIRLRGRLGNDKDFTFGFIKKFVFADEDQEFFLAEESPTILIETIPDISLNSTDCCHVQNQDEISVAKGIAKASLEVFYNDNKFILSFDIPRLMWKVQGLDNGAYLGWQSKDVEIPIDDLQTGQDVSLIIRANLDDGEKCSLCIKKVDYKEEKTIKSGRVKFELRSFGDSILYARLPVVSLLLNFNNSKYAKANRCVLKVRTEWTVERDSFSCIDEIKGDIRTLWIEWSEKRPVRNRIMRLWDCRRPWREPVEYQIEEGKTEIIKEESLDVLPSGNYRAEFTFVDEWAADDTPKTCPVDSDFNVFSINLSGDVVGLTDAFELYLIDMLSKKAIYLLTMPETVEDAKRLHRTLFYLFREGYLSSKEGCLELCCDLWNGIATGKCQPFIKEELCNLTEQVECLLLFKRGEMIVWHGKKLGQKLLKNKKCDGIIVQFLGIEYGKIVLNYENNPKITTELRNLNKFVVAPPNSKIGPWRKKRS